MIITVFFLPQITQITTDSICENPCNLWQVFLKTAIPPSYISLAKFAQRKICSLRVLNHEFVLLKDYLHRPSKV
jgi:hypothetical protein